MKKLLIIVAFLACCIQSFGQIQLLVGKDVKAVVETEKFYDRLYAYSYLEAVNNGAFWQVIGEYRIAQKPLSVHIEARTFFCNDIIGFAGLSYSFNFNNGFIGTSLLTRVEKSLTTGQIGLTNSFDFGLVDIYGYADIWLDKGLQLFLEERCYFNVWKDIAVGGVVNVIYGEGWQAIPYIGLRYKF